MCVCVWFCQYTLSWHSTCLNRAIFISSFDQSFSRKKKQQFFLFTFQFAQSPFILFSSLRYAKNWVISFRKPYSNFIMQGMSVLVFIDRSQFAFPIRSFFSSPFYLCHDFWTDALTRCHSYVPILWKKKNESFAFIISFTWQLCKMACRLYFFAGREVYWNFSFGPSFNWRLQLSTQQSVWVFFFLHRPLSIRWSTYFIMSGIFHIQWNETIHKLW